MELRAKMSDEDMDELGSLLRSKWYWPKYILRNAYGFLLLLAILIGTIAKALSGDKEHWPGLLLIWVVIAGIFVWARWKTKSSMRKERLSFNASRPNTIHLDANEIRTESDAGVRAMLPWGAFDSWQLGQRIILLKNAATASFFIIPMQDVAIGDRESLVDLLTSRYGAPKAK